MNTSISRRGMLAGLGAAALAATQGSASLFADDKAPAKKVRFCLNTSTIRGQKLAIEKEIDLAAEAGFDAIEPWINELDAYVKGGGKLADLDKRIKDKGLTVPDAIGFPEWIVDNEKSRAKGIDEAKRCMEMVRQIGCEHLACPPVGATNVQMVDLSRVAQRYTVLLELGDQFGVTPQVEMWGFSSTLGKLGEAAHVAIDSGHPKACVLADVYHLYKGGSGFKTLKNMSALSLQVFHVNDYPADKTPAVIGDADRVYPGDGVAPIGQIFKDLRGLGFAGAISLELFNPEYWKQDAALVAKTGLQKMKAVWDASA